MSEPSPIITIFETLLEQTKAIRDVKVQTESLKQMMFEHRPAFVPAFAEQVEKISSTPAVQQLDSFVGRLERALASMKAE
jgi:hypothetical protein